MFLLNRDIILKPAPSITLHNFLTTLHNFLTSESFHGVNPFQEKFQREARKFCLASAT